jgi:hypothetical protein
MKPHSPSYDHNGPHHESTIQNFTTPLRGPRHRGTMSTSRKQGLSSSSPSSVKRPYFISPSNNADSPIKINTKALSIIAHNLPNGHADNPQDINGPTNLTLLAGHWGSHKANEISNRVFFLTEHYPILEALVAHLRPKNLVQLAQTCQSILEFWHLSAQEVSRLLLTKTLCPSEGLVIRRKKHPIRDDSSFGIIQACGGDDDGNAIESHPCTRCSINTCDECRIHLTYNDMIQMTDLGIGDGGRVISSSFRTFTHSFRLPNLHWV